MTANSGSGSKFYKLQDAETPFSAVKNQERVPNVSKVTVTDKQFTVTTYRTSDMTQVDSFTIKRDGGDSAIDQTNVSLSMGADQDQMNLTWYANSADEGTVTYAPASQVKDGVMPADAKTIQVQAGDVEKTGYHNFQTTLTDLEDDTEYAYQLTNGDKTSQTYTFTSGGDDGSYSFAYVGDPQLGASGQLDSDQAGWKKTLGLIQDNDSFKDVTFMLSAGDQINNANTYHGGTPEIEENQYDYYLNNEVLNNLPTATVIGNHDSNGVGYGQHFNVPNESDQGKTNAGGDYYFVYNKTLFMDLNSNNLSTAQHKAFMEQAIAATKDQDIDWKVVTFHHSIYSVANHAVESDILQRRNELAPLFKDLDIDVVLQGHDHVYVRSYMMDGLTPLTGDQENYEYGKGTDAAPTAVNDPKGILYVTANSGSGSKFYNIQNGVDTSYAAVQNQEYTPNVSKVTVEPDSLTVTTYRTNDMSQVDTFTIKRGGQENDITLATADHGSLTADKTAAKQGDTVTLTPAPDAGYKTTGVTVKDADGNTVEVAKNDDGTYTFTMPDKAVTVTPTFAKKSSGSSGGGSSVTTYAVEKPQTVTGGSVTTDKTRAVPGSKVTATVTPEDGYAVKDLKVTDKDGKTIDVTKNADGTYSFTMPAGKVTVTPVFEKKDNGGTATTGLPFKDVPSDAWYLDDLRFVFDKGLMTGTAADLFEPQTATNRAMIVSILYRMEGNPEGAKDAGFTDVAADDWFAKAVNWAAENKIVGGFGDGTFRPNEPISREQMASILSRYTAFKGQDVSKRADLTKYTDADQIGDWAEDVVSWANAESLIKGTAADKLDPKGQTTRAQAAAIFARYNKTILK